MKNFLLVIGILVAVLFVIFQLFTFSNSNSVMSNQAAFKVYSDLKDDEVDDFFEIEKGTFNKDEHLIVCDFPVEHRPFKIHNQVVTSNSGSINCNEEFDAEKDVKYDNTELNDDQIATLLIINKKSSMPIQMVNERMGDKSIVASRPMYLEYERGKINHVVISKDKVYNFCIN